MLIGLNVFGDVQLNNVSPQKQIYNDSYFYGESILDDIHLKDFEMEDSDILNISTEGTFTENSLYLFQFNNNLEGGSIITGLGLPLSKYVIRRRVDGESLNVIIDELDYEKNLNTYIDYYPRNNLNYTYTLTPIYDDGIDRFEGQGTEGGGIVSFFGWSLTSIDKTPVVTYNFDLEIKSGTIKTIKDYKIYENYTKYPAFRFGEMNYTKGRLSTIPYTYNESTDEYSIDLDTLNNIKTFINDNSEKILRNANGEAFKVITYNFDYKYVDQTPDQIYSISFEFTEVGEYTE